MQQELAKGGSTLKVESFAGRNFRDFEFFGRSGKLIPAKSHFTYEVARFHPKYPENCTKKKKKSKNT